MRGSALIILALTAFTLSAQTMERQVLAMGTRLSLRLEGNPACLEGASEAAIQDVNRIEGACSTWNSATPWSRLNLAKGQTVQLDAEWIDVLGVAKAWQVRTNGAFDPCLGALMKAWGIRSGGRMPSPEELSAARAASGAVHLNLDTKTCEAWLDDSDAAVEEGGFIKGYALDRAARAANSAGAPNGLLDFGGQLLAWGKAVAVSIADPLDRQASRLSLRLKNASLSTSSCTERGRHILDPRTGEPCEAWGAVSVVASTGLEADILSTALFVMGPERGLTWANAHHVAAIFLPNHGKARMSRAFRFLHPVFTKEPS